MTTTAPADPVALAAPDAATGTELAAMRQAIAISAFGLGRTSPAPPAGCVILDQGGRIVGQGYRLRAGDPGAEANALAAAAAKAAHGTAVITLEPDQDGAQELLDAGISRVVTSLPQPRGSAVQALADAGVQVVARVLEAEALTVLGGWFMGLHTSRPTVTWAYLASGHQPRPLPRDLTEAEMLRARADVVLRPSGQPAEAVPGAHGPGVPRLPAVLPAGDPAGALAQLHAGGVRNLFLGGHPTLAVPFVEAGLVDRVVAYLAPLAASEKGEALAWPVPAGFRVTGVRRERQMVRVQAARAPQAS